MDEFDAHAAEGRPISLYARDNIVTEPREAAASPSVSAHFGLPFLQHLPNAAVARVQKARLGTLMEAVSPAEHALKGLRCGTDHVSSGATAVVA